MILFQIWRECIICNFVTHGDPFIMLKWSCWRLEQEGPNLHMLLGIKPELVKKWAICWEKVKSNILAGITLAAQPHNKQPFNPTELRGSVFDLTWGALPDFNKETKQEKKKRYQK